jgi:hypothetical protein
MDCSKAGKPFHNNHMFYLWPETDALSNFPGETYTGQFSGSTSIITTIFPPGLVLDVAGLSK